MKQWPRRLIIAPTDVLHVDKNIASYSPKGYTQEELQSISSNIPKVYQKMEEGWTQSDFDQARWSQDSEISDLGKTYGCLFKENSGERFSASLDGNKLIVDSGNHRIRAAKELGVPAVPVWTSAKNSAELNMVESQCASRLNSQGYSNLVQVHNSHLQSIAQQRSSLQTSISPNMSTNHTHEFGVSS